MKQRRSCRSAVLLALYGVIIATALPLPPVGEEIPRLLASSSHDVSSESTHQTRSDQPPAGLTAIKPRTVRGRPWIEGAWNQAPDGSLLIQYPTLYRDLSTGKASASLHTEHEGDKGKPPRPIWAQTLTPESKEEYRRLRSQTKSLQLRYIKANDPEAYRQRRKKEKGRQDAHRQKDRDLQAAAREIRRQEEQGIGGAHHLPSDPTSGVEASTSSSSAAATTTRATKKAKGSAPERKRWPYKMHTKEGREWARVNDPATLRAFLDHRNALARKVQGARRERMRQDRAFMASRAASTSSASGIIVSTSHSPATATGSASRTPSHPEPEPGPSAPLIEANLEPSPSSSSPAAAKEQRVELPDLNEPAVADVEQP